MTKIKIKALSVNKAWQGRRFKTKEYTSYEAELFYKLPKMEISKTEKLFISLTIGYSNKLADIDNFVKPFLDVLQKKYGFNDSQIYEMHIMKTITEKGKEFIEFDLVKLAE